jgi:uncharacterized repeat protein (TIGR01451 family)
MGVAAALAALGGLIAGCGSSSEPEQQQEQSVEIGQTHQALAGAEGLDFFLNSSEFGYVGTPTSIGAGIFYFPPCIPGDPGSGGSGGGAGATGGTGGGTCDTAVAVSDVTLTMTVSGNFDFLDFGFGGPEGFSCTQAPVTGGFTVTCHADTFEPFTNGGFNLNIVPIALGDIITTNATLTAGGVEVRSETRFMTIIEPSADLIVLGPPGGTGLVGQTTFTSLLLANNGPISAVNPRLSLTLTGDGQFTSVNVFGGSCTSTATTATCEAGSFPIFFGVPVSIGFVGNTPGQIAIHAVLSSDTPDPDLANNEWTTYFDMVEPRVADLAISMTDSPDPVKVGKALTYSISLRNNGPDTANYPVVMDMLPYRTTFVSATPTQGFCYGGEWGFLQCEPGPLAAGQSMGISVVVTPLEGGTISNLAQVFNADPAAIDPDLSNNFVQTDTTVKGPNPPVTVKSFSDRFYTSLGAYVECANDFVLLEGYLHTSYQTIYNEKSGFFMITQIFNPQGMTGTGFNTGDTYHATGMTRTSQRFSGGFPKSFTFENNFRIIGDKTGNDLLVHQTTVVTLNPDGTVKSEVTKYSFECK